MYAEPCLHVRYKAKIRCHSAACAAMRKRALSESGYRVFPIGAEKEAFPLCDGGAEALSRRFCMNDDEAHIPFREQCRQASEKI
ncbi:MAG: hypothetical protein IKM00_02685 [Clostridia bacterium]|nr:hypothetical protein [Clostridia bacterium]